MAEDIDIRSVWRNSKDKIATPDIAFQEGKKTKTTLYWIKFILWIEFWLNVVGVGPMIYILMQDDQVGLSVFYGVITVIYLFYYQFLIRKINGFHYDGNVVESLKRVYGYLRFYLLHYKVVIWLSLIIGVIIGIFDSKNADSIQQFETIKQWIIFGSILTVFVLIFGGFLHWLIHLIYGRKIKRLKQTVKDLENQE